MSQPHEFFLDVAAVHQQCRFLQDALRIHLAPDQLLHARLEFSDVGLQHGLTMFLHSVARLSDVSHALPQFPLDAAAFFFAHLVEAMEQLFDFGEDCSFKRSIGRKSGRDPARRASAELRSSRVGRQAELGRGGTKGLDVAADDLPVQREALGSTAVQIEG